MASQSQPINNITDEEAHEMRKKRARDCYYENREANNNRAKAYYHANKERIKLRQQSNSEERKAYYTQYYAKNRKTIIARASKNQKQRVNSSGESFNSEGAVVSGLFVDCECGCKVKKYGLPNHCKTQKHITAMANGGCVTRDTISCPCGSVLSKKSIYNHRQTAKHKKFLLSIADVNN